MCNIDNLAIEIPAPMMRFETALEFARRGFSIRRASWPNESLGLTVKVTGLGQAIFLHNYPHFVIEKTSIKSEDILANDWSVMALMEQDAA